MRQSNPDASTSATAARERDAKEGQPLLNEGSGSTGGRSQGK
jgi:hypothetical protein